MMDVRAAVYAGVAAGIVSTIAQIALWAVFSDAFPAILLRDARLAAAIVMGRVVLPPPASFEWQVMLVATLVHLALSIIYGLMLSWLITRLTASLSVIAGAAFGLALYTVNMYGFTVVFPWFEATRDPITAASHVVFGTAAALVYKMLSKRHSMRIDRARGI
jgi:hypothetical protein